MVSSSGSVDLSSNHDRRGRVGLLGGGWNLYIVINRENLFKILSKKTVQVNMLRKIWKSFTKIYALLSCLDILYLILNSKDFLIRL